MFNCILVANRGEIACRVIETARALGVRCIAVYSDADAGSKHVEMADAAVRIGGPAPADSYLRAEAIIDAALATGAEAIHPGYGFLSENPAFVEQVEAAGLVFIGPSAQAIRAMGLKDAAKALMIEAGVPVVPGYHGANQADAFLQTQADEIGYPVLIKAVAGGGGKGMRLVRRGSDFAPALASARSEALSAFGNSDVLVEKFIPHPRHIELQIFGDGKDVIHLFERDCSLQRRHQKVIEEAPAPGMPQEVREAMGRAAVLAAKAIGYRGAGTVEFIVDGSGDLKADGFYFMEMNTRLQVEHPVTEAITGIDLVEWQLRVAAGAPLPCAQADLRITGHAFEARLYAEDVEAGFLPATGTLDHLLFPANARIDSGVRAGDAISPYYDPMIAKLIVAGPTRDIALARFRHALASCEVAGSVTNLAFLGALAGHKGFAAGDFDTGLIERDFDALTRPAEPQGQHWVAAAMCATGLDRPAAMAGFALWVPLVHRVRLGWQGQDTEMTVEVVDQNTQRWSHGAETITAKRHAGIWSVAGAALPRCHMAAGQMTVFDSYGLVFDVHDPLSVGTTQSGDGNLIEAPMPGLIKLLAAVPGQPVMRGDRLAVLEAMKMEHALLAARDGIVAEVFAQEGDQVAAGAALIRLEDDPA